MGFYFMSRFEFAPHFSEEEFRCNCGCELLNVSRSFLERLERARLRAGIPFKVQSGCRCEQHNKDEGGKEKSAHLTSETKECTACDIGARGSGPRFVILDSLFRVGFTRIGIAKSFLHVDEDPVKDPQVTWLY